MTAACPACGPAPERAAPAAAPDVSLYLPDIHCAGCIAGVEEALATVPGVREARVNLSRRRVAVATDGQADEDTLIARLAEAGHRAQRLDPAAAQGRDAAGQDLLLRLGVAGFAMMNVMLLSVAVWSGAAETTERLFHLISAAIALPAVLFSGRPFFASALGALRAGRLNMDVPISLAIALASGVSLHGALAGSEQPAWFDAALALTFFLLIGRYLDHAGRAAARSAAADLAALEAPQARLLQDGAERIVPAAELAPGQTIRVRAGDRLPADGVVEEGRSELDRSALTGESAPAPVTPGEGVAAGETNLSGVLTVRVTRAGRDTALARLADLVATAESQRSARAGIADRAARVYAPLVHVLGAAAFLGWWAGTGDPARALTVAISVLVITCPCALGLAVPAVSTVTTARLLRRGVLVKSRTALERLAECDTVVFDKTGTLTTGTPRLEGTPPADALALAAGLAAASSHPYSRALADAAAARGLVPAPVTALHERPGLGVEGRLARRPVRLGRPGWIGVASAGATEVRLADTAGRVTAFRFTETPRDGAAEAVETLRGKGYRVVLLSGDAQGAAGRLAATLGIEEAAGGLSPEDKVARLRGMAADGRRVLMVGDGLNDTGALAEAHASMAPGSALDAARSAADLVLLSGDLRRVAQALDAAQTARARMGQNIWLASLYNVVAVPVALAGLATPFIAALAMSTSSVTVSLNAARRGRAAGDRAMPAPAAPGDTTTRGEVRP